MLGERFFVAHDADPTGTKGFNFNIGQIFADSNAGSLRPGFFFDKLEDEGFFAVAACAKCHAKAGCCFSFAGACIDYEHFWGL